MPKLAPEYADQASEAESSFSPLEEGVYTGRLAGVEAKESRNGKPMWTWEFDEIENFEGVSQSGRLWVNTVIQDNTMWKLNEMFTAFGYTTDSDTDEMVGERCKLVVSQRLIEAGARKGQTGNNVDRCLPLEHADSDDEGTF